MALLLWMGPGVVAWWQQRQLMKAFTDEDLALKQPALSPSAAPITVAGVPLNQTLRLALGPLDSLGQTQPQVSDLLLAELSGTPGLELIEREALAKVLTELNLNLSGLVRAQEAVRVGKLVRADWFLLGSSMALNGTNFTVVRMVDAHTGILREAAVFNIDEPPPQLAARLAAFVRQCRQNATAARLPTYLALGAFEDLSLNSRQQSLPSQLRAFLTAAYQNTNLTLLEREFANTLFREVQLDLAGLTEEASSASNQMQSAYWMVDGAYQSYETTNLQVEAVLYVRRLFGRSQRIEFREEPGKPFFDRVKVEIDRILQQEKKPLNISRMNEIGVQLSSGRELIGLSGRDILDHIWVSYDGYQSLPPSEMARRIRNTKEAVRAFETVLLLDPTNREARICLATCFRRTLIERLDEARDYYREMIEGEIEDRWSQIARQALLESFRWTGSETIQRWFERAANSTSHPAAQAFYQTHAQRAREDTQIENENTSEAMRLAEVRLFETIQSFDDTLHKRGGRSSFAVGMDDFAQRFGENRALAGQRLAELYPRMKAQFPDAAPYLLATVMTFQVDTNAPIIAEFRARLKELAARPQDVIKGTSSFWNHIRHEPYTWALERRLPEVAAEIIESRLEAAKIDPNLRSTLNRHDDEMALAYAHLAAEQWEKALEIFDRYQNKPLYMGNSGPWGKALSVILTGKMADQCREKLGLPVRVDPREFNLGEICLHLHSPRNSTRETSVIQAAVEGLWIAFNNQILQVNYDLKTNFVTRLPTENSASITALSIGRSAVWIGTAGGGLFEIDSASRQLRHFTEKDGLLMNDISSLFLVGDTLWIGYGNESAGGLGRMDVNTRKFISFMTTLTSAQPGTRPPRDKVTDIRSNSGAEVWFLVNGTQTKFRPDENVWESVPDRNGARIRAYELDRDGLISAVEIGQTELTVERKPIAKGATNLPETLTYVIPDDESPRVLASLRTNRPGWRISGTRSGNSAPRGAIMVQTSNPGDSRELLVPEGLPSLPTTLHLHGRDLWVGGQGFVALVDLETNSIKRLAHVPTRTVDQIQVGGGYVWVKYENHLYRAPLNQTR